MAKVRSISGIYDDDDDDDDECIDCIEPEEPVPSVATNRVQVRQSPFTGIHLSALQLTVVPPAI